MPPTGVPKGNGPNGVHNEVGEENLSQMSQQSETFQSLDPINSQISLANMSQDNFVEVTPSDEAVGETPIQSQIEELPKAGETLMGAPLDDDADMSKASELLLSLVGGPPPLPGQQSHTAGGRPRKTMHRGKRDAPSSSASYQDAFSHGPFTTTEVELQGTPLPGRLEPSYASSALPSSKKKKSSTQRPQMPGGMMTHGAGMDWKAKLCEAVPPKALPGVGSGAGTGQWAKTSSGLDIVKDETDDKELDAEEAEVKKMYKELGHDVEFADLQIQTSNIKVSFEFENQLAVSIDDLCAHLVKDQRYQTGHFNVRIKDKSAASNGEGRTFFGGVLTITMDVWGANEPESVMHNTSVRMFGFKDADPSRRHKAQFNGCTCKHAEILSFFDEVFGAKYKMDKIRVEPNSVFSATDNAVMDPAYGIHIEGLVNCLKSSKLVEHYKEQVTGGVNFTFRIMVGETGYRHCKPTVQKSGSIQLMLVDQPRRIRLETMRFLIMHCKTSFVPLADLNLTKRTVDKRHKARSLLLERRAAMDRTSFAAVAAAAPPRPATVPATVAPIQQIIPAPVFPFPAALASMGSKAELVQIVQGGVSGGVKVCEEGTDMQEGMKKPVRGAEQASPEARPAATATATADAAKAGEEEGESQDDKGEDGDVHSTQPPQSTAVPVDT